LDSVVGQLTFAIDRRARVAASPGAVIDHEREVALRMVTVQVEESEMPQKGNRVRSNSEMSQTYEFYRS
jgi:hypothetical protein